MPTPTLSRITNPDGTTVGSGSGGVRTTPKTDVYQFEQTTGAVALGAAGKITVKRRLMLPTKTVKDWRVAVSNFAFLGNANATGSLTGFLAAYGKVVRDANGEWSGAQAATGVALTMSATTLTAGNWSVSNWVDATTYDIGKYNETQLSFQFDIGSTDQLSFGGGEQYYSVNQAGDLLSATPGTMTHVSSQAFLNIVVEFRHYDDTITVLNVGNSLSGGGNAASPNFENHGEYDSWGGQFARRKGVGFASIAVAGSWAAHYDAANVKWNYYDRLDQTYGGLVPDIITFVAFNSSDLIGSGTYASGNLATAQAAMKVAILKARAKWPKARIVITNNPPRVASTGTTTASLEGDRLTNNAWMESCPAGVDLCVDIDRIATDWASPARLRAAYDPGDGTHGRPRYYSEMAKQIAAAINERWRAA